MAIDYSITKSYDMYFVISTRLTEMLQKVNSVLHIKQINSLKQTQVQ